MAWSAAPLNPLIKNATPSFTIGDGMQFVVMPDNDQISLPVFRS